jgi:hypothetical protein
VSETHCEQCGESDATERVAVLGAYADLYLIRMCSACRDERAEDIVAGSK